MDFTKIKNFHSSKDTFKMKKKKATGQEEVPAEDLTGEGLVSRIIRKQRMQLKMGKRFEKVPAQHRYMTSQYGHD